MENRASFQDYAIIAFGTVKMKLNQFKDSSFLNTRKILYMKPGRHEAPQEV
jgi:hypothetical protein